MEPHNSQQAFNGFTGLSGDKETMRKSTVAVIGTSFLASVRDSLLAGGPAKALVYLPFLLLPSLATAADHFDVASVRLAERPTGIRRHSPGRIAYEGIGPVQLITQAFALPRYRVVWPDWVPVPRDHPAKEKPDNRYFTIEATMPPETNAAEFQLMLQNLLVERFGLAFHRETRELAQYEVSFVEGGPKMALAKALPDGPLPGLPEDNEDLDRTKHANTTRMVFGPDGMLLRGDYTVAQLAEQFSDYLRHPMVDRTGSAAFYAIELRWGWNPYSEPPEPGTTNRATDGEAKELFSGMEKKLGLKVTLRPVPTEFLVIDRLSHEATGN
jgi:uncharacterized protein (TIGR03435 family)